MKIKLTKKQTADLKSLANLVDAANESGDTGALFAQVFPIAQGYMNVRFIPPRVVDELNKVLRNNKAAIDSANEVNHENVPT
jgi:hypothetical protein